MGQGRTDRQRQLITMKRLVIFAATLLVAFSQAVAGQKLTLKDITNILKTASEIVPSSTECTTWSACTIPSTHISDEGEDEPYGI